MQLSFTTPLPRSLRRPPTQWKQTFNQRQRAVFFFFFGFKNTNHVTHDIRGSLALHLLELHQRLYLRKPFSSYSVGNNIKQVAGNMFVEIIGKFKSERSNFWCRGKITSRIHQQMPITLWKFKSSEVIANFVNGDQIQVKILPTGSKINYAGTFWIQKYRNV